jgi:hypothetical protein
VSLMFVGAIAAFIVVMAALGGSRVARQWAIAMYCPGGSGAARHLLFLLREIEMGFI